MKHPNRFLVIAVLLDSPESSSSYFTDVFYAALRQESVYNGMANYGNIKI